ncbi:hypothetical protein LCGC14_2279500 [marine sediment metagenome]|uniref:Uncharacterized protein n=1 Tax=marine sediment metagenome TaxID=412755 RepID=A0A0F9F6Z6_9ZZZZ
MSRIFSSPKKQKLPPQQVQQAETIETVTEDATEAGRRRRKKLVTGGAPSTRISGIRSALFAALKKRLGE